MRKRLQRLTLKGFKTIRALEHFELGPLAVLIGPNGAGKSNFLSFFRMLSSALSAPGNLQVHIAEQGGAGVILHDGPERTREIEAELTFSAGRGKYQYAFRLAYAARDTLIYSKERFRYALEGRGMGFFWNELSAGQRESQLTVKADELGKLGKTAKTIVGFLRGLKFYQFHNTSAIARIRGKWDAEDNRWLKEDGANLAPMLRRLHGREQKSYQRIVDTLRLILPFFADFELEPEYGKLLLSWRERNSDRVFNASQAADGMLRVMAIVTLLLQPERNLPDLLILDEPELGLHPYAINVIGGLIRGISQKTQVVVATQSMPLVDCFEPGEVVVVERNDRESEFRRLDPSKLKDWLKEYSLSELWEKNVFGGRPT